MYSRIMVPLDGSELAECVLPHVEAITKGGQVKEIVFIRIVEKVDFPNYVNFSDPYIIPEKDKIRFEKEAKANAEKYLKNLVTRVSYGGINVRWQVLEGPVAESLYEYAVKNEVNLIIIATHGRSGVGRWVLGSVADRILRSACVPVLMVRAPGCKPGI